MCVFIRGKLIIMLNFEPLKHVNYQISVQFWFLHGPPTQKTQLADYFWALVRILE